MIEAVKHVSIHVRDQGAALAFYTNILGFKLVTDASLGKQRWIELELSGGNTKIVLFTPEGQEDRIGTFSNIVFTCKNVEATYRQLKEKGVHFTRAPSSEKWGNYALFTDPDGNTFCLSSP